MIKLNGLSKIYDNSCDGISNINFTFDSKGMYIINGESGAGKTTLLNVLGLIDTFDGEYQFFGLDINKLKNEDIEQLRLDYIGYIFQDFKLIENLTVIENIKICTNEKFYVDIDSTLSKWGLAKLGNKLINELSAGQKQRVAIARAIIKSPKVLLCDEPTGNLDFKNTERIMNILKELSKDILVIVVSHDSQLTKKYADNILNIKNGTILNQDKIIDENITASNISINRKKSSVKKMCYVSEKIVKNSPLENFGLIFVLCFMCAFTTSSLAIQSANNKESIRDTFQYNNEDSIYIKYNRSNDHEYTEGYTFNEINNEFGELEELYSIKSERDDSIWPIWYYLSDVKWFDENKLLEGRLPQTQDEVIVTDYVYEENNYNNIINLGGTNYEICGYYKCDFKYGEVSEKIDSHDGAYYIRTLYCYDIYYILNNYRDYIIVNNILAKDIGKELEKDSSKRTYCNIIKIEDEYSKYLLNGRMPKTDNEILISEFYRKKLGISYEELYNTNYEENYYINYFEQLKNSYTLFLNFSSIKIVGVIDLPTSYKQTNAICLMDNAFNIAYKTYCDCFSGGIYKLPISNFDKAYDNPSIVLSSMYSTDINNIFININYYLGFFWIFSILNCIFVVAYLLKDISTLIKNQKGNIGILLSLGFKKKDMSLCITIRYFFYIVILSIPSFIVSYFLIKAINEVTSLLTKSTIIYNVIKFSFGKFLLPMILLVISTLIITYISCWKIRKNNIVSWVKN